MSKQHFLSYINLLVANSPYNKTILAERARVSRQALHKLLSGEVEEAKLSTMINVAYALDVHPIELIRRFFLPPNVTIPDSRQQTAITIIWFSQIFSLKKDAVKSTMHALLPI
jgi:DNA-binding Xre family transcriptional regulator